MGIIKFNADTVSDQKRLVRGEHLLMGRTILRARDCVHNAKWRVLMLSGGSPSGELGAIRELMPHAHITAVDRDQRCLDAAIEAGADDVIQCELGDLTRPEGSRVARQATPLAGREFDLVHLDLCSPANLKTREIVGAYRWCVKRGVYIVTFSYGRDVTEAFEAALKNYWRKLPIPDAPDHLQGRLMFLLHLETLRGRVSSVMTYRGANMPMCSVLLDYSRRSYSLGEKISFVQIEPNDFEMAVSYPDAARLYDCPQERIDTFRRRFAAMKAVATRRSLLDG